MVIYPGIRYPTMVFYGEVMEVEKDFDGDHLVFVKMKTNNNKLGWVLASNVSNVFRSVVLCS